MIKTFAELRAGAIGGAANHIVIEPDGALPISYIVVVPRGEYDVIRAQAIDVPVKTNRTQKVAITISGDDIHGLWLKTDSDAAEDDIDTHFALVPERLRGDPFGVSTLRFTKDFVLCRHMASNRRRGNGGSPLDVCAS